MGDERACGILLLTHGKQGESLLEAAEHLLGECPPQVAAINLLGSERRGEIEQRARLAAERLLIDADGVLLLSDLFGSTQAVVAAKIAAGKKEYRLRTRRQFGDAAGSTRHAPSAAGGIEKTSSRCRTAGGRRVAMIEARAVIVNSRGLHARPAAKLAKLAGRYASDIEIYKGRRKANAKSIASLLTLAAAEGAKLQIVAAGEDEKQAAEALLRLIAAGFRDDEMVNNPRQPEATPRTTRRTKRAMYRVSGVGITESVIVGRAHIHSADEGASVALSAGQAASGRRGAALRKSGGDGAERLRRDAAAGGDAARRGGNHAVY